MGFLMTTESQDLGLTSHPKDFYTSFLAAARSCFFFSVDVLFCGHGIPLKLILVQ